jgi:hypothetical protein
MLTEADHIEEKRRLLAAIDKEQLVLLVAKLLVSAEALLDSSALPNAAKPKPNTKNVGLKLTKAWRLIMSRLANYAHFRADDVILVSRELQKDGAIAHIQTSGSARAQLCHLTRRGAIKRLGGGNYRVNEEIKVALKKLAQ